WGISSSLVMPIRRDKDGLRDSSARQSLKTRWRRAMVKRTTRHRRSTGKSSRPWPRAVRRPSRRPWSGTGSRKSRAVAREGKASGSAQGKRGAVAWGIMALLRGGGRGARRWDTAQGIPRPEGAWGKNRKKRGGPRRPSGKTRGAVG